MADPVLRLDSTRVSVEPGGQAQVGVTVTSTSAIVEGFSLEVLGEEPQRWAEVVPPSVNVFPGEEATAVVVFSPPKGSAAPSGVFPFGVIARSTESRDVSAVVEGDVEIGQVQGLQAKIIPVTSAGRWRGRHVIQLSNWGNASAQLRLVATDPDAALGFYLRPDLVDLPVGGSATVRLSVRTRKPFLRGSPTRLPFQVVGEPVHAPAGPAPATPYGDPGRPVVDAALNQLPILSRAVVTLVGLVLVLALAAGAWAYTRPRGAATSLAKLGTPPRPDGLTVVATDPTSVTLKWKPVDQIERYDLAHVDPGDQASTLKTDKIDSSQNVTTVTELPPAAEACFKLRAVRPGLEGPWTDPVCTETAPPPATASPGSPSPSSSGQPTSGQTTGGQPTSGPASSGAPSGGTASPSGSTSGAAAAGVFGGGRYALVVDALPKAAGGFAEKDAELVQKLKDEGFANAQTLDSEQLTTMLLEGRPLPQPAFLTVVGPYDSRQLAQKDCAAVLKISGSPGTSCLVAQPEPS